MDLYGPAWSCMVPYGPDWAHIGDDFVAKKFNNEIESNYGYMVRQAGTTSFLRCGPACLPRIQLFYSPQQTMCTPPS